MAANPRTFSDANWESLGLGLDGTVNALTVMGGNLYAGGSFTKAGTNVVNRVAKWDGTAWSALGSGMSYVVSALAVSGTNLYAGGQFIKAGDITVNGVAKWDGSAWSALASGVGVAGPEATALAVLGTNLYDKPIGAMPEFRISIRQTGVQDPVIAGIAARVRTYPASLPLASPGPPGRSVSRTS